MTDSVKARWFFDVVSPFSYLHLRQFERLHGNLEIELVPVLFAGLLRRWDNKGPVEIPCKRLHTYRYCALVAATHGIPFRMPPRHPFNPLPTLRLLLALGPERRLVETAFDFIFAQGRDPEQEWPALTQALGATNVEAAVNDPEIKQRLIHNTEEAAQAGVFGVPTFLVNGQLFWGADTVDWMNAFLADPGMFERGEMRRALEIEFGSHRKM